MPNLRSKTWTTTTPATVGDAQYWEDHLISDTAAAKAASSVQSVNSITPDQYGNVEIGNAGHTIQDDDGNDMPKQDVLQFVNADVTNDTVNEKTVVDCKGAKGDAATITVGTVTTLPAGSDATVTNSGTSHAAVFNFGIPKGADGTGSVDSVNGYTGTVVLDASDVGALPDSTTIPTKTSELDNDSGFVISSAIPTSLSELSDDSTHRLVTDAEKTAWDAKVSESLLKDTVGWVGKNLLNINLANLKSINTDGTWNGNVYTKNGITYTVLVDDGGYVISITTNGTASARGWIYLQRNVDHGDKYVQFYNECVVGDYIFSDGVNTGIVSDKFVYYNKDSKDTYLLIDNGVTVTNLVWQPMIRNASIADDTYAPYHPPVSEWGYTRQEANVLGAINLWKPITTETLQDVTYTQLSDGGVNIDGTASVNSKKTVINSTDFPKGTYKCKGTNDANLAIVIEGYNGSTWVKEIKTVWASDETFDVDYNGYTNLVISLRVLATKTIDNKTIYPMLVTANTPLSPYVKPAMTNRELTDAVTPVLGTITSDFTVNAETLLMKVGKVVVASVRIDGVTKEAYTQSLFNIPAGFRPKTNITVPFAVSDNSFYGGRLIIGYSGLSQVSKALSNVSIFFSTSWITEE